MATTPVNPAAEARNNRLLVEGKLERTGTRFQVFVSDAIDYRELDAISDLLYEGARKLEREERRNG